MERCSLSSFFCIDSILVHYSYLAEAAPARRGERHVVQSLFGSRGLRLAAPPITVQRAA
jgi:hypothetical protein